MIRTKVRRIGSSLGVLLPKRDLEQRGLKEGDFVQIPNVGPMSPDLFGIWKQNPVRLEYEEER